MSEFEDRLRAVLHRRDVTNAIMADWGETQATVAATVNVRPGLLHADDLQASLAGWGSWLQMVRPNENEDAVLLDNTTVVNALDLISGSPPSANTLLDLNTFLTAVTYYGCAVRLEHPEVERQIRDPIEALNSAVGSALVRTLPVPGAGSHVNRGVVGVLHAEWLEAYDHILDLETYYSDDPLESQEFDSIRSSFAVVMGRPVPEPLFDTERISHTYGSDVASDQFLQWRILDASRPDLYEYTGIVEPDHIYRKIITEAAVQNGFNCQLGNALDLPYLPNQLRTPYRKLHYKRDRQLTEWMGSLEDSDPTALISALNQLWRQPIEGLGPWITLPLPLSYCLAKLPKREARPDDWFNSIGDLRTAMAGFRKHRRELQNALDEQDTAELKRLATALGQRPQKVWRDALAPRWLLTVPLAVVTGLLGGLPIPILIAVALASGVAALPDSALIPLRDRLGRRHVRFASEVGPVAGQLQNWLPTVAQVWGLKEDKLGQNIEKNIEMRLSALRKLENST
jgi:hypothetical protein